MDRPALFFLHGLGLSARAVAPLAERLGDTFDVVGLDLPGFGDAATGDPTVEGMVAHVEREIAERAPGRWLLAGHSMGGKVATIVAARTMRGEAPLFGLAGVVLLAASPPSPEPIEESRRDTMIALAAGPGTGLAEEDARDFVDSNTAGSLPTSVDQLALAAVRRASREAWTAWLQRGSREDWSTSVGRVDVPALVLAGAEDGDLGVDAQRDLVCPHYPRGRLEVVDAAAHFLMLEQPDRVAELVTDFWERVGTGPTTPTDQARVLAGPRTSARTRAALAGRALGDDPAYAPQALDAAQLATLRAVGEQVVPQDGPARTWVDLAARVDAQLAAGEGDGWRPAGAPPDDEAYRRALGALAGFADLDATARDARLRELADGDDAAWFEDCRTDLVRAWLGHPATLARIGFDGVANGGDGERKQGFVLLGLGQREDWEPAMAGPTTGTTTGTTSTQEAAR